MKFSVFVFTECLIFLSVYKLSKGLVFIMTSTSRMLIQYEVIIMSGTIQAIKMA